MNYSFGCKAGLEPSTRARLIPLAVITFTAVCQDGCLFQEWVPKLSQLRFMPHLGGGGGGRLDSAVALSLRSEEAVYSFPGLQNQPSSSHGFKPCCVTGSNLSPGVTGHMLMSYKVNQDPDELETCCKSGG